MSGRNGSRGRSGAIAFIEAMLLITVVFFLRALPFPAALAAGRGLGRLGWWIGGRRKKIALHNLRCAFGHRLDEREISKLARESYRRLGMTAVEGLVLPRWLDDPRFIAGLELEGPIEELERRHKAGEPFLLVSGHLGAWELLLPLLVKRGWNLALISRPLKNRWIHRWLRRHRTTMVPTIIDPAGALPEMGKALRSGCCVALMVDQNDRRGLFVDFLGRPAASTQAVGVLTRRYRTEVVYLQARRLVPGLCYRIRFEIGRDLDPDSDGIREHVAEVTRRCSNRIEAMVRESPADWLWVHQRWKTRPDGSREIIAPK